MKNTILTIMREANGYVSGQELSERLGVSRTAIWKNIRRLREEGYEIEAVTNKGYRLLAASTADVLNEGEVTRRLQTKWAGHPVIYAEKTGSTNEDIMALSERGFAQGTLAIAEEQTNGKGRRGRNWKSPARGNIYMSILLHPEIAPDRAPMATLIMALSIYQTLTKMPFPENVSFGIKWPNDIVVTVNGEDYKKCAGILTEMRMEEMEIKDVTIGTGINVNESGFPEEIAATATSLKLACGEEINRAQLIADIWQNFEMDYEIFLRDGDLSGLKESYEEGLVNRNRAVHVLDPKGDYTGMARGITDTGELIVLPDGKSETVTIGTGEISVRGVMGYV